MSKDTNKDFFWHAWCMQMIASFNSYDKVPGFSLLQGINFLLEKVSVTSSGVRSPLFFGFCINPMSFCCDMNAISEGIGGVFDVTFCFLLFGLTSISLKTSETSTESTGIKYAKKGCAGFI